MRVEQNMLIEWTLIEPCALLVSMHTLLSVGVYSLVYIPPFICTQLKAEMKQHTTISISRPCPAGTRTPVHHQHLSRHTAWENFPLQPRSSLHRMSLIYLDQSSHNNPAPYTLSKRTPNDRTPDEHMPTHGIRLLRENS